MPSLAISLGHNSSAILIQDGRIIAGFEEERFSGVKADSNFPMESIGELVSRYGLPKDTDVYIGHWFIDARLPSTNKYWIPEAIKSWFPDGDAFSLSPDFTHHDSHLESAMVFAGDFEPEYTAVVADGFGSFGECISIYEVSGAKYRLIDRKYGFEKSLGMLYQYATAFMGMKMHNHEYKMLAYEVHAPVILEPWQLVHLKDIIFRTAQNYLKGMYSLKITSEFDPVTKIDALPAVQRLINNMLNDMLIEIDCQNKSILEMRSITSYFVQHVVESVMSTVVGIYKPKNLLLVGGLFYNVKLNHILAESIPGRICIMPLAGDQGAALGVYNAYQGDLIWPDNLAWGDRDLIFSEDLPKGIVLCDSDEEAGSIMEKVIEKSGFCNLVRGKMEFGPRALCNTSTIALPSERVAKDINAMNARTMEMPFAPVLTKEQANSAFIGCDKVHKSLEYMIITRSYQSSEGAKMPGAAHWYPEEKVFTGRPQITAEPLMVKLLDKFGPLVNTSFNYHGVPIVRSEEQILNTHVKEWETHPGLEPTTVIVRNS